jgi:hypothetical protein
MRVSSQGWLEREPGDPEIHRLPTVRTCALVADGPHGLVWHATGGVGGATFAEGLARRIQRYQRGVDRPASWHLLIARDTGSIYQSAPFSVGTWHVGRPGIVAGARFANVNAATIGVELENAGPLMRRADGVYVWPYFRSRSSREPDPRLRISPERVEMLAGVPYDRFPAAQIESARRLLLALTKWRRWGRRQLGYCHADFASPAKTDPGALWRTTVLPRLLDEVVRVRVEEFDPEALTVVTGAPAFASA